MGRGEEEAEKDLSKLFYPAMQVSEFHLQLDVAYGGTDQRHAHMLQRCGKKDWTARPGRDPQSSTPRNLDKMGAWNPI